LSDLIDKTQILVNDHGYGCQKMIQGKLNELDLLSVGVCFQEIKVVLKGDVFHCWGITEAMALIESLLFQGFDSLPRPHLVEHSLIDHRNLVFDEFNQMGKHDVEGL
jgi:hypothetical protein